MWGLRREDSDDRTGPVSAPHPRVGGWGVRASGPSVRASAETHSKQKEERWTRIGSKSSSEIRRWSSRRPTTRGCLRQRRDQSVPRNSRQDSRRVARRGSPHPQGGDHHGIRGLRSLGPDRQPARVHAGSAGCDAADVEDARRGTGAGRGRLVRLLRQRRPVPAERGGRPSTFGLPGRRGCRRDRREDYSLSTTVEGSVMGRISLKMGATGAS